jgi:hypothetical protein
MMAHPTDMSLVLFVSGANVIFIDLGAHLPTIVPSIGIPKSMQQAQQLEGIFNVQQNEHLLIVINRSAGHYTVFNRRTGHQVGATRAAIDVVLSPHSRYAELDRVAPKKGKEVLKSPVFKITVFDDDSRVNEIAVSPKGKMQPLRMVSFGDFFAVIVGATGLDLAFNMTRQPKTTTLVYRWSTLERPGLQFDGAAMLTCEDPLLAVASPNGYAIFDMDHDMKQLVQRPTRVLHFKFFKGNLYILTVDGLEVDNLQTVSLVSARFSHLLTVGRNTPLIPVNSMMIEDVKDGAVTVVDTRGNTTSIGIPEGQGDAEGSLLVSMMGMPDPIEAASQAYDAGKLTEDSVKKLALLFLNDMGWDAVEPFLAPAERAISELAMNSEDDHVLQDEFMEFVMNELDVNPLSS